VKFSSYDDESPVSLQNEVLAWGEKYKAVALQFGREEVQAFRTHLEKKTMLPPSCGIMGGMKISYLKWK
jgi:hypothetical protein